MLSPSQIQTKFQFGLNLHQRGRHADAAKIYEEILAIFPKHSDALHWLGVIAFQNASPTTAIDLISQSLAINPKYAVAHNNLGNALKALGHLDEAIASFDKAIALKPDFSDAYNNRGNALNDQCRFDEAMVSYNRAIALKPNFAEAYCNRGMTLTEMRRFDEALASYDKAIVLMPDCAAAYHNRSQLNLLIGRLEIGWKDFESRKAIQEPTADRVFLQSPLPLLNEICGKSVCVHWEQGLGDTLQFCRYIELLQDRGASVSFAPQPSLRALLDSPKGKIKIVAAQEPPESHDYHLLLASLPLVFATTVETIPSKIPYVFASETNVEKWSQRIGDHGFKIGICWQGSNGSKHDAERSFSIHFFETLSRIAGVRLISLHKGAGENQLKTLPDGMTVETLGSDFDAGPDAFCDTAAVMMCLDLVITSDTAIAHLAGALGVRTWLALQYVPDWRWMLDREDSPWYPTMRLFRQSTRGDWKGVFERIRSALLLVMEGANHTK